MSITTETADLEEVYRAVQERRRPDPEVARRVRERADRVKEEIRRRGMTDIAVTLIREARTVTSSRRDGSD